MGNIYDVDIEEELKNSYLTYAMSVIVSRAIPDVRDGLKPVHRRILFSMHEMGLKANSQYKKAGRIVGDVLGKYHPHGDQAIYSTLVRMAQNFSMRYVAIDGHGNFGSIDGDPPAAMRYTEARLSKLAELMLKDIEKETVDFGPNYDDSMTEPLVLPSAVPFQLINGASGIAVGMATNIAPHNIKEVVDAIIAQIDNPEIQIKDLMRYIKGPDFPTGGIIYGTSGIKKAYKTGKGHIIVRARLKLEETRTGKDQIVITELPYQVNKKELIERIAELVKEEKINGISFIRDESDRNGLRIVIELKKDSIPRVVINQLYTHTNLQISFSVNNLFLVKGKPKVLSLKDTIQEYIDFRKEVIYKRTRFELKKAEERAHIVEGLLIALANIDEIIELIKKSADAKEAKEGLIVKFNMSEIQAQAVLDMRLQRLTSLEVNKLKDEFEQLKELIKRLKEILSSDKNVLDVVKEELINDTKPFIDERRTEIVASEIEEMEVEDLIQKEDMVITISHRGFIKRAALSAYRNQTKGGTGSLSGAVREDDFIEHLFIASTHDYLLFFSNKGLVYRLKVHQIPLLAKTSKGQPLKTVIGITESEKINAILSISDFNISDQSIILGTKKGIIKKTQLSEFISIPQRGKKAITLDEGDEVVDVKLVNSNRDIILATKLGKALRFNESKIRVMGRAARGITGIRLMANDNLCSICVVDENSLMLLVTENGYGKRLDFDNFSVHGRGTSGQRYYKYDEKKGVVVSVKQVYKGDDVLVITSRGLAIKIATDDISKQGRNASGIRLVKVKRPDFVASVSTKPKN